MSEYLLDLEDHDGVKTVAGALSASYTQALDALANCAHAPHGQNWPRREPNWMQAAVLRDKLDRIERMCVSLGVPVSTRRNDVESYFTREANIWREEQQAKGPISCCCSWGAAVGGRGRGYPEYPEFGCARCPVHKATLGETELCHRHANEVQS